MDVRDLVANRLEDDRTKSRDIADKLVRQGRVLADDDIREFFPELDRLPDRRRSNWARGVPLPHQFLLGPPTVFDLEPLSPPEFEERYLKKVPDTI